MNAKVLITGVSSGIGLGLARKYLEQGAAVYGISRRRPDELSTHPNFRFQSADLTLSEEIISAIELLSLDGSDMEAIILNAGVHGLIGDTSEIKLSEFLSVMNVNAWANKILLDTLFTRCSTIKQVIALSSHAGTTAYRESGPYCVSKAALNMLIALYAIEKPQTHFCAIAPPLVNTEMQDYLTSFPPDQRYAALESLKSAKENGDMLSPAQAAEILIKAFATALKKPTGSFITDAPADMGLFQKMSARIKKNLKSTE